MRFRNLECHSSKTYEFSKNKSITLVKFYTFVDRFWNICKQKCNINLRYIIYISRTKYM